MTLAQKVVADLGNTYSDFIAIHGGATLTRQQAIDALADRWAVSELHADVLLRGAANTVKSGGGFVVEFDHDEITIYRGH